MKEYDMIVIGSGSAMNIVTGVLQSKKDVKIAVIEKDEPGGICLTRGCIPSKMILYPAEIVGKIKRAHLFGIDVNIGNIDFFKIMEDMRKHVGSESKRIEHSLRQSQLIDFYPGSARFVSDHTLQVNGEKIKGEKILLCTGSRPLVPPIKGIDDIHYLTSETFLKLKKQPKSMIIVGGGYIAVEYGYFMAMMGSEVHIIGRNPRLVPQEEPDISEVLKKKLSEHMKIHTGYEVVKVAEKDDKKGAVAVNEEGETIRLYGEETLIATGRRSNSDILSPENSGIELDKKGWIKVDRYLETTKPNIWALGDATGRHMFKHAANYESRVVFNNAFGSGEKAAVDYHAVPHGIFTDPEIAGVGMSEKEAREKTDVLVGKTLFTDTGKGDAMKAEDCFVKVMVEASTYRILGAHIIGPQASVLIQEIVNLMYTPDESPTPIFRGMHIHPALSEVVERAFYDLHKH
ncbi:MAG: dihydrolipoyl dehydrogenase [Thermoplasmata archaeon]